ncbi:MAG: phage terminase large subunit family protein [Desulfobacteraceae bacterium]|jgi:phage terminase large subunit GpA-like protein
MLKPEYIGGVYTVKTEIPEWMPEEIADRVRKERSLSGSFFPAERKVLRRRAKIRPSKWAEKHRVLEISSLPGPWKNRVMPYLAGIMDASFHPAVQVIIICKGPQSGVSEAINNCIGYAIDREPGPVLYHYPDQKTSRDNFQDRIKSMISTSRRLRSYTTGNKDDFSAQRIKLEHMPIYAAWSRSAASLANKPIRYLVNDELDKYVETAGKRETDPVSLAEKRTIVYRFNRKIWKISTPNIEDGFIWTALNKEAQVIFDYWVKCPECEAMQVISVFSRIKWPENKRDPEEIMADELAWFECKSCKDKWDNIKRDLAVRDGEWRSRDTGTELFEYLNGSWPKKIGFHMPSWISHFVSLSEPVSAFLKGQKSKNKLKDFKNNHEAVPWVIYAQDTKESEIMKLCDDRPRNRVPGDGMVAGLVAGVDTQDYGFWYRIRGFGYGGKDLLSESWGIREGYVETFGALEEILWQRKYYDEDGNHYPVLLTIQDALGHRTSEVYDFCRKNKGKIFPSFGKGIMAVSHSWTSLQFYPGKKKPIPGGLMGINVNTKYFKDKLLSILQIHPSDPGAWHENAQFPEGWARHMVSEYIDEKGAWQLKTGYENHLWDCAVLCLVAHEILDFSGLDRPETSGQRITAAVAAIKQQRRVRYKGMHG